MKILCACLLYLLLATACHTSTEKKGVPSVKPDTASYYPVSGFFKKQVEYVDLRSFDIRYLHTLDDKKDSVKLTKEMFIKWGDAFMEQAKNFQQNRQLYKESVFEDLSTQSITLNYTPFEQVSNGIQYIDVLLDNTTRDPKRVMIKVAYTNKDTSITEQYNWKAFDNFQLIRSKKTGTQFSSSEVTYVTWNEKR